MSEPRGDQSLLERWRAGDEGAARQLFDRYVDQLMRIAQRHISERLGRRVSPEDIVQSVFRTFFVRAREGQFEASDPDGMCKLLARITVRKVLRQANHHRAAKRDVAKEASPVDNDGPDPATELFDRGPTPDEVHAFVDQLEHFLSRLGPQEREVLELRMQGCSPEEIAKRLGTYDRKIYRILERIRGLAGQEELGS
jgi:RNA polymerase sigma-70 factor (ECF subfamily)